MNGWTRVLAPVCALGLSFAGIVVTMMMATSTTYTPISPMISPTFFGWWVFALEGSFNALFTLFPLTFYKRMHGYEYAPEAAVSRLRGDWVFTFFVLAMFAFLPKTPRSIGMFMLAGNVKHFVGVCLSNLTHFHTTLIPHLIMVWCFVPLCIVPLGFLDPSGFATIL